MRWKKKDYILLGDPESYKETMPEEESDNVHIVKNNQQEIIIIENINDYFKYSFYNAKHELVEAFNIHKRFIALITIIQDENSAKKKKKEKDGPFYSTVLERIGGINLCVPGLNYEDARSVYNFLCECTDSKCSLIAKPESAPVATAVAPEKAKRKLRKKKKAPLPQNENTPKYNDNLSKATASIPAPPTPPSLYPKLAAPELSTPRQVHAPPAYVPQQLAPPPIVRGYANARAVANNAVPNLPQLQSQFNFNPQQNLAPPPLKLPANYTPSQSSSWDQLALLTAPRPAIPQRSQPPAFNFPPVPTTIPAKPKEQELLISL